METVKEIKEKVRLTEVADFLGVEYRKEGEWYKMVCFMHDDHEPSLAWKEGDHTAYCFGCGKAADAIEFIKHFRACDYKEALKVLREIAGDYTRIETRKGNRKEVRKEEKSMQILNYDKYARLMSGIIEKGNDEEKKVGVLASRGIKKEVAGTFYIPATRIKEIINKLIERYGEKLLADLISLKIVTKKETDVKTYLYPHQSLCDRLIFPFYDKNGNIVGVIGYRKPEGDGDKKYVCLSNNRFFRKKELLLGFYDGGLEEARKAGFLIVVEGPFDMLRLREIGHRNVVATCTSRLTKEEVELLKREGIKKALLMFDGDKAGRDGSIASAEKLVDAGIEVRIARLPDGADPDSHFKEGMKVSFEEVEGADIVEFTRDVKEKRSKKGKILVKELFEAVIKKYRVVKAFGEIFLLDKDTHEAVKLDTRKARGMMVKAIVESGIDLNPNPNSLVYVEYLLEDAAEESADVFICKTDKLEIADHIYYYTRDGVVKVTPDGVEKSFPDNIYFLYKEERRRIPMPVSDGNGFALLVENTRCYSPKGRVAHAGCLVMTGLPSVEKPIFVYQGATGVGKSDMGRVFTTLFGFPTHVGGSCKKRDFLAIVHNSNGLIMDEVDKIRRNTINLLNTQSLGGTVIMRRLYTNSEVEEITIDPDRTTIILSHYGVWRKDSQDFNNRLVHITLKKAEAGSISPAYIASKMAGEIVGAIMELASVALNNPVVKYKAKLRTKMYCNPDYEIEVTEEIVGSSDPDKDWLCRKVAEIKVDPDDRMAVFKVVCKMIQLIAERVVEKNGETSLTRYISLDTAKEIIAGCDEADDGFEIDEDLRAFSDPEAYEVLEKIINKNMKDERDFVLVSSKKLEQLFEAHGKEMSRVAIGKFLQVHKEDLERLGIKYESFRRYVGGERRTYYKFWLVTPTTKEMKPVITGIKFIRNKEELKKIERELVKRLGSKEAIIRMERSKLINIVKDILVALGYKPLGTDVIAFDTDSPSKVRKYLGLVIVPRAYALLNMSG